MIAYQFQGSVKSKGEPPTGSRAGLQEAVRLILEELKRALNLEMALLARLDRNNNYVEEVVGINIPSGVEGKQHVPLKDFLPSTETLKEGKILRVDDPSVDPQVSEKMRKFYANADVQPFVAFSLLPAPAVLLVSRNRPISETELVGILLNTYHLEAVLIEHLLSQPWQMSRAEHAANQEYLMQMLNTVTDPVVLSDAENNVLLQNEYAQFLLKADEEEENIGRRRAIEMNNFLLSAALSSFTLDQGASLRREVTLVNPEDGTDLLFEVICNPIDTQRRDEKYLVAVLKNLTDLHLTSEELRQSLKSLEAARGDAEQERDRLQQVLEGVADPIVVATPSNEIIYMSHSAQQFFRAGGHQQEKPVIPYYTMANETKLTALLVQFGLENENVKRSEVEFLDPATGEQVSMSATASKIQNKAGQLVAYVCVLHDLSQVRELERRRVEQEMFEIEKQAAVGRLAASVAHEVNNPLEAIKNSLYLAVSDFPANDPTRKFLEIAKSETERASRIIRQMVGFARPETKKVFVNINEVLREVLTLAEGEMRGKGIAIRTEWEHEIPMVPVLLDQMKQVFLNLFINAREAMEKSGELTVATRVSRRGDPEFVAGKYLLIEVSDTGKGIKELEMHRIFEPFFSTKRDGRGVGLGLWVCQDIVVRHGGRIRVRSKVGRGSTFTVALPIGGEEHDEVNVESPADS